MTANLSQTLAPWEVEALASIVTGHVLPLVVAAAVAGVAVGYLWRWSAE